MLDVSPDGGGELDVRDERNIAGGYAAAVVASTGDVLEVIDLEGQQVGDFVGFALNDRSEWLSVSHTRAKLLRLNLAVGDLLQTNWRRPML